MGEPQLSRQLRQRLPAVAASVRQIRTLAVDFARTRCDADERLVGDIALCVSEAAGNAVAHAYSKPGGEITLRIEFSDQVLTVEVCDEGAGTGSRSSQPGLGVGMKIVEALCDASFEPVSGTTGLRVVMRFPCGIAPDGT
jgi:anti-sigma regulatory factor (Ser/Thr protein kinase)